MTTFKKRKSLSVIKAVLQNLSNGTSVRQACRNAGIMYKTFYSWVRHDKKFAQAVDMARDSNITIIEDALTKQAKAGNVPAITFYLKNRKKDKWAETFKTEHTLGIDIIKEMKEARERVNQANKGITERKEVKNRLSGVL